MLDILISNKAYLFDASYEDGKIIEVQVNSEFKKQKASEYASQYAKVIGQLPTILLTDVETVWIHKGKDVNFDGLDDLIMISKNGDLLSNIWGEKSITLSDSSIEKILVNLDDGLINFHQLMDQFSSISINSHQLIYQFFINSSIDLSIDPSIDQFINQLIN